MCGITGIVDFNNKLNNTQAIEKMLFALKHRGPDDSGIETFPLKQGGSIYLGHQRLSIIDLTSAGHQPMSNSNGNIWVTANGEIYNYKSLKSELSKIFEFRTESDTEILLAAYEKWDEECLDKIKGMFAFSIFDRHENSLFLARDPLGIKPLYYYLDDNYFLFSSEIRSLLASGLIQKDLNFTGVYQFLVFGRIKYPQTIIKGIYEIPPGNFLKYHLRYKSKILINYWDLKNFSYQKEAPTTSIYNSLRTSLERRLVSDVPVGIFLSGGIDSSAITKIASDLSSDSLATVSMNFKESKFDESPYSNLVAKQFKTNHKNFILSESDFLQGLEGCLQSLDQPSIDGINTYFISKCAHDLGLKVILSGIGGDELFAGYPSFQFIPRFLRIQKLLKFFPKKIKIIMSQFIIMSLSGNLKAEKMIRLLIEDLSPTGTYHLFRSLFFGQTLKDVFKDQEQFSQELNRVAHNIQNNDIKQKKWDIVEQISYLELTEYTIPMLLKDTDVMSMAHGLEVRVPFLDPDLVRLLFSIPGNFKMSKKSPKSLLLNALEHSLPPKIVNRKKMGFTLPFANWMKNQLKAEVESVLFSNVDSIDLFLDSNVIKGIWVNFLKGKTEWSHPWSIYVLKKWVNQHIN